MIKKAVRASVKCLAIFISFIFNYKTFIVFERYGDLFYTYWMKRNFKKCNGIIIRYIKLTGGKYISIGTDSTVNKGTKLEAWDSFGKQKFSPEIRIGKHTMIGNDCHMSCVDRIFIGNEVAIAARCLLTDHVHGDFNVEHFTYDNGSDIPDVFLKNAFTRELYSKGPIIIEDNVHIGENCTIMPGVTVGHNSVVSSNSVVVRNLAPYSLASGNPAKSLSFA